MPELPEVETTRFGLEPHVRNHTIQHIIVRQPSLRWPIPNYLADKYTGSTVTAIRRRGKYLLFETRLNDEQNATLLVHLGMSGSLRIVDQCQQPRKHDHVDFILDNQTILRFHDPRRFGCILECPDQEPDTHVLLKDLGPEPLGDEFTGAYLHQRSRNRSLSIKNFIMDSHIVVGLGNIYATESLHLAGIHPLRAAGRISRKRYEVLVPHAKRVIENAIALGGTTLRDFVNSKGNPGYFQQQLRVYGRDKQPCLNCSTPIRKITQNQRSSWYCPNCQH
ncbi:MAG: bifunctional DNA-formamidopyrimidine glycosylase/DNA-(apurinic or apyrimidinic site) lyase [Gammaproteobacteria bacterium]|nr:bifunctional DNA-formamidopyrimidine glycosylase/DNA-(apurinic or apyrimidinic site) lyase [Gammaproteobacteria bacterium]